MESETPSSGGPEHFTTLHRPKPTPAAIASHNATPLHSALSLSVDVAFVAGTTLAGEMQGSMTKDELFDRVVPEPNSGCWFWALRCDKWGYGRSGGQGAHRLSYEIHCGEIPAGMSILHSCDQPCCVNPDHLRPGTKADNARDRSARGRSAPRNGENSPVRKLSAEQVASIRADKRRRRFIAVEYGICPDHVGRIRNGTYWT